MTYSDGELLCVGLVDIAVYAESAGCLRRGERWIVQVGLRWTENAEKVLHAIEGPVNVGNLPRRRVIVNSEAAPHHGLGISQNVVGKTQAWAESLLVVFPRAAVEKGRLPFERVVESGIHKAAFEFVPQSKIEGEAAVDFPVILEVVGHLPDGGPVFARGAQPLQGKQQGRRRTGGEVHVATVRRGTSERGDVGTENEDAVLEQIEERVVLDAWVHVHAEFEVMRAVPVDNRREIVPELQAVLLHTLGRGGVLAHNHGRKSQIDPKTRGVQLVDEAVEVEGELVDGGGGNHPGVHPLPGDVLVGGNLEGAVGGRATNRNIRVNAQAFAGSVALESSAEAEGMVAIEMMVEAAHHQQIAEWCCERAFKLREDPRGVHGLGLFLTVAFNGEEPKRLVLNDRGAERAAELLAAEIRLGRLEKSARLQVLVTEKSEGRAVVLVRTGLGHHVNERPGGMAVLGGKLVGDDLKFLDGIFRHQPHRPADDVVVEISSVHANARATRGRPAGDDAAVEALRWVVGPGSVVNLTLFLQKWPKIQHLSPQSLQQSLDFHKRSFSPPGVLIYESDGVSHPPAFG